MSHRFYTLEEVRALNLYLCLKNHNPVDPLANIDPETGSPLIGAFTSEEKAMELLRPLHPENDDADIRNGYTIVPISSSQIRDRYQDRYDGFIVDPPPYDANLQIWYFAGKAPKKGDDSQFKTETFDF